MSNRLNRTATAACRTGLALMALVSLVACQLPDRHATASPTATSAPPAASGAPAATYLEALGRMAPGDPARQQAALLEARAAWQQSPLPGNTLRYALMLGTPGHDDSNPLEASRLLAALLASPERLSADELRLASAFQREFTTRVAQYADLARARMDADAALRAADAENQARINALAADLARTRRERDAVQQKLDAIADIEKTRMERDGANAPATEPTTP
jgi:hypothetical protein